MKNKFKVYWIYENRHKKDLNMHYFPEFLLSVWNDTDYICLDALTGKVCYENGALRVYMLAAQKGVQIRVENS